MRISTRQQRRARITLCIGVILSLCTVAMAEDASRTRPNLVFVLSDQQSSDMLGCYGNKDIVTPNFDRFAEQGVRFENCISNSPVCTPYRGILLTGQHPLRCGAIINDVRILPGNGNYFGEVLRDAGYRMGYYGKWHLYGGNRQRGVPQGPYRYGFDHEFLTNNCTLQFDKEHAFYWDDDGKKQLYGDWESDAQTKQAMGFIDQHAGKPFALFLSWHPPHNWGARNGYAAPEEFVKLYDPAKIHLRPTVKDTLEVRKMYQGHMAMISSLDRAFGWLMDKLDEKGLTDNTIVVFTSDHGDVLLSYDWWIHKHRPEHVSSRVPLMIRYPKHLKPRASDLLIGTFDLMPTLLSMMNQRVPKTCEGQNLSNAIAQGNDDAVSFQPLFYLPGEWRGIYTKRYTYAFSAQEPTHRDNRIVDFASLNVLYDRETDPWETTNLFHSDTHASQRQRLHEQTLAWMKQFGDTGLDCRTVMHKSIRDEDWVNVSLEPRQRPANWEGRFKGRPIDFID